MSDLAIYPIRSCASCLEKEEEHMMSDLAIYPILPEAQNAHDVIEMALSGEHVTPEQIIDALNTVPGGLPAALSVAGSIVLNMEAKAGMLEDAINRLQGRKAILDHSVQVAKRWALQQCQAADLRRITAQDGSCTLAVRRNPPHVEILNVDDLPENFTRTEFVVTPLKTVIKDALKAGQKVPGARLVQDERLDIR